MLVSMAVRSRCLGCFRQLLGQKLLYLLKEWYLICSYQSYYPFVKLTRSIFKARMVPISAQVSPEDPITTMAAFQQLFTQPQASFLLSLVMVLTLRQAQASFLDQ